MGWGSPLRCAKGPAHSILGGAGCSAWLVGFGRLVLDVGARCLLSGAGEALKRLRVFHRETHGVRSPRLVSAEQACNALTVDISHRGRGGFPSLPQLRLGS